MLRWKMRLAAVAKQNGGPIQHWSVDWYELLWRSDVACVQPTTSVTKNCLQTLFYDEQHYFACITANMEAF